MTGMGGVDLKVALIDSDYYTEKAIHAYLAWDRRTRALTDYSSLRDFWRALDSGVNSAAYPDVIILDVNNVGERGDIRQSIQRLVDTISDAALVCLSHIDDLDLFYAAAEGARAPFCTKMMCATISPQPYSSPASWAVASSSTARRWTRRAECSIIRAPRAPWQSGCRSRCNTLA